MDVEQAPLRLRRGKFAVHNSLFKRESDVQALFDGFVPLHVEPRDYRDMRIYVGLHPSFAPVGDGDPTPAYQGVMTLAEDGGVTREFVPTAIFGALL